jgi:hypothetical protein
VCHLPRLDEDAGSLTKYDHPTCVLVIVQKIQHDNNLDDDVGDDLARPCYEMSSTRGPAVTYRSDRDTDHLLLIPPMLNVVLESEHLKPLKQ